MNAITVRHNFETGHRLPFLPGKCENLHGHSWWAEVTVSGPLDDSGILVEYGTYKRLLRAWIDTYWDHGLLLGDQDPLLPILRPHGKVYEFPGWPTVERVAEHLAVVAQTILVGPEMLGGTVTRVHVQETHVNAAEWTL